ncbi:MAG TPA: type II toxin-antitoxin system RelE/ParE family toxin [Acetobacteraceae bacterium]
MKRYILSPEAQQDLRDIRDYLLMEAGLPVSRHVMRKIGEALRFLSVMPGVGHFRQDLTGEPVKFWQVFSYLIIYDHLTRPIGIARVLHSSRDIAAVLAGVKP